MFCPNCGTGAGAAASTTQGGTAEQPHTPGGPAATPQPTGASPTAPTRHRHFPFGTIVAAVILVAAVWMLFTNGGEQPIKDLKEITFDVYDDTCDLGTAVSKNTSHAQWTSEKIKDGYYRVTLNCVDNMYGLPLEVEFLVTYTDEWVHGSAQAVSFSGDRYSDSTSLMGGMLFLYGQMNEDALYDLMAYDMLWDLFS